MATDKQIAANQANAMKSTGPRTVAGKAVVALNALRHGMRSKSLVLPDEDQGAFDDLRSSLLEDLAPEGMLEAAQVDRMAELLWRIGRAGRMEAAAMAYQRALSRHEALTEAGRYSPRKPDWQSEEGWATAVENRSADETESWEALVSKRYGAQVETFSQAREGHIESARTMLAADMTDAGAFHTLLTDARLLENLSRYEVGLYRQFEAVLAQFWTTREKRARLQAKAAPVIDQSTAADGA